MAEPTWYENKKETIVIINGERWLPETSHQIYDYEATLRVINEYCKNYNDKVDLSTFIKYVEDLQEINIQKKKQEIT